MTLYLLEMMKVTSHTLRTENMTSTEYLCIEGIESTSFRAIQFRQ